ncbi:NAD-dependent epimerase/dehydratase family protein [Subtercola sp. PAMC28395]|uniref:NAD-dependent epimerase/dehydratase family protein n=1 Tax=Subtercola sp. PAMC28395 TaxID=2846775 RepID=UPI001C0B0CBD|nr:NAD-dependent epimerase/dehydratase family protein [Subtercola sp. PAMC28395]QWT25020.1 NAD-dependent epimerase/dehydratase family protein [Subtercola sp. PAMC28395]
MTRFVWVVGSGGLLGSALLRSIHTRRGWRLLDPKPMVWGDAPAVSRTSSAQLDALFDAVTLDDSAADEWAVVWVAGSGVIGTSRAQLDAELRQFRDVMKLVESRATTAGVTGRGSVFLASSAGGVYGGSRNPPYTEATAPVALAPYGETKLQMEAVLDELHTRSGISVVKGRIANIYGPGQKLTKMQGLISTLAKAQFSPTPASIFVPLDTVRDYLYVDDCAHLVCDVVDRLGTASSAGRPQNVTKIIASGDAVTIGALVGHFQALSRRKPHIMLGSSPTISMQALDLRLRSIVWPELDDRPLTPLPAGIHATMLDIMAGIQSPQPPAATVG